LYLVAGPPAHISTKDLLRVPMGKMCKLDIAESTSLNFEVYLGILCQ
jgi:hypothetical protein